MSAAPAICICLFLFIAGCTTGGNSGVAATRDASADARSIADVDVDSGTDGQAGSFCEGASDGTPCSEVTLGECKASAVCRAGACVPTYLPEGTPCGDPSFAPCSDPDTCDGQGQCLPNHKLAEVPCGDPRASDCSAPDSCDGSGSCRPNHMAAGVPCGSRQINQCTRPDVCTGAGSCIANHVPEGTPCTECPWGLGHCDVCRAGECANLCKPGAETLTTTFNTTDSGNAHTLSAHGLMFDVHAVATPLVIHGMDLHLGIPSRPESIHDVSVFAKDGSHFDGSGVISDAGTWGNPLVSVQGLIGNGAGIPTRIPGRFFVYLNSGAQKSFYVTTTPRIGAPSHPESQYYRVDSARWSNPGQLLSTDGILELNVGHAVDYPITEATGPAAWNGTLHYSYALPTGSQTDASVKDVIFTVQTRMATQLDFLLVRATPGDHTFDISFRMDTSGPWTSLVSRYIVHSQNDSTLLPVPFDHSVSLATNKTASIWVKSSDAGLSMTSYSTTVAVQNSHLTVSTGIGTLANGSFARGLPNGAIAYSDCKSPQAAFADELILRADQAQVLFFNPSAALQTAIRQAGFVPSSNEFGVEYAGIAYSAQRAEQLGLGETRVFYVRSGQSAPVYWVRAGEEDGPFETGLVAESNSHLAFVYCAICTMQRKIYEDKYAPTSPVFRFTYEGVIYEGQRTESLTTGQVRVYWVEFGHWGEESYVLRP